MNTRQSLGKWGESFAAKYLDGLGYIILEQNVRTPYGEIDLIALHETTLVFIEVKTRSTMHYGLPEEAITAKKRANLLASVDSYIQEHPDLDADRRIDVISVVKLQSDKFPTITHFENAIS